MDHTGVRAARIALDPARAPELLRATLARSHFALGGVQHIEALRYVAGERLAAGYVADLIDGAGVARERLLIGVAFADTAGQDLARLLRWVVGRHTGALRVPRVLGYDARQRFLLLEPRVGASLAAFLMTPDGHHHLAGLGAALARFHRLLDWATQATAAAEATATAEAAAAPPTPRPES
ncbi:MAG: hypothetical protein GF330_11490, partial [Candidatus Eisenbacteria bacterium]|nr:hypothetical protein [Candidatus Eisenbacteria bacterium]